MTSPLRHQYQRWNSPLKAHHDDDNPNDVLRLYGLTQTAGHFHPHLTNCHVHFVMQEGCDTPTVEMKSPGSREVPCSWWWRWLLYLLSFLSTSPKSLPTFSTALFSNIFPHDLLMTCQFHSHYLRKTPACIIADIKKNVMNTSDS